MVHGLAFSAPTPPRHYRIRDLVGNPMSRKKIFSDYRLDLLTLTYRPMIIHPKPDRLLVSSPNPK